MTDSIPTRDDLAALYLDQLAYEPYPIQEEALLSWFMSEQGVLVCTPTGTGKTLIAEAALFEALHTGTVAYYTTPLIALTEQKFREMQDAAVRWGFDADEVGLVTGNRRVNPDARVLVVVAEILLNRLLNTDAFDFANVSAVVMDEFHSFADRERGIVWELTLGMLPKHIRLLLLSATVGNSAVFLNWLNLAHGRKVELVQSKDRKVPLSYHWVPDQLLSEQLELMVEGGDDLRKTPALVFCFNREECWSVAEQMKGKRLLGEGQRKQLIDEVKQHDWSQGVGPKLKPILLRGIGVHHAGLLPKYKRIVEHLFQRKLLSVAICTETLAAGINLPARSVVMTSLIKGPPGRKKLVDSSSAHQIFGRAGRPQFDDKGYVFALPHEDDVKIARWKEKYDTIPEDTKDPLLIKAKKKLKKKMPKRRSTQQYWSEAQFETLKTSPPANLASTGPFSWRLLAYLLSLSPDVGRLRSAVRKRLMEPKELELAQKSLHRDLLTLWAGGFVTLDPEPPPRESPSGESQSAAPAADDGSKADSAAAPVKPVSGTLGVLLQEANARLAEQMQKAGQPVPKSAGTHGAGTSGESAEDLYVPEVATPTHKLQQLLVFRSINPIFGVFLVEQLGIANRDERIQAFESALDIPRSVVKPVRVPPLDQLPQGPLALERLNTQLLQRGLATASEITGQQDDGEDTFDAERWWPLTLSEKLRLLFDSEFPGVHDVRTTPVWAVGELLRFGGDFNKLVTSRSMVKQEGILFRHVLRYILLMGEFSQLCPAEMFPEDWTGELQDVADQLTQSCRQVDAESTDKLIESAKIPDLVEGEAAG